MNQEALKGMLITVVLSVVTSAIVGGTIFYSLSNRGDYREKKMYLKNTVTSEQNTMMNQKNVAGQKVENKMVSTDKIAAHNCKQTGGSFANSSCACQKDFKYDTETGYCMGAMGVAGGDLQSEEAVKLELVMLKNTIVDYNCTQSGGTFKDLKCACPKATGDQLKYDPETGYCMDSFGAPGGELGQTERKLQELMMLKNQ